MSSTLPRRVAQAALLVAAGAAPVVGASTAHAAALPLGGLSGVSQPDVAGVPLAALGGPEGLTPDAANLPVVGSQGLDGLTESPLAESVLPQTGLTERLPASGLVEALPQTGLTDALPQTSLTEGLPQGDVSALSGQNLGSLTQPDVSIARPDVSDMARPEVGMITQPAVGKVQGLADRVNPDVSKVVDTDAPVPAAVKAIPAGATDEVGQQLEDSVLGPAMMGVGPSLPVAGYAADKSINAGLPAADAALMYGTQRHLTTNSAETMDGVSTPLREVPYHL
ncbi:hypothetical protein [Yinghuangia sp. YIM S09857]|uniref:hypothetical protein n=1 Tax=Yinghuangia sp. YIM S09857 TaxID=3436929 RepID=UPI003F538850